MGINACSTPYWIHNSETALNFLSRALFFGDGSIDNLLHLSHCLRTRDLSSQFPMLQVSALTTGDLVSPEAGQGTLQATQWPLFVVRGARARQSDFLCLWVVRRLRHHGTGDHARKIWSGYRPGPGCSAGDVDTLPCEHRFQQAGVV